MGFKKMHFVPDGTEFGDSASVPVGELAGEAAVNNHIMQISKRYQSAETELILEMSRVHFLFH